MVKIIETNISFKDINVIGDVQSRLVYYDNWSSYVKMIKSGMYEELYDELGDSFGFVIIPNSLVEIEQEDDHKLILNIVSKYGVFSKKLCYLVK